MGSDNRYDFQKINTAEGMHMPQKQTDNRLESWGAGQAMCINRLVEGVGFMEEG